MWPWDEKGGTSAFMMVLHVTNNKYTTCIPVLIFLGFADLFTKEVKTIIRMLYRCLACRHAERPSINAWVELIRIGIDTFAIPQCIANHASMRNRGFLRLSELNVLGLTSERC